MSLRAMFNHHACVITWKPIDKRRWQVSSVAYNMPTEHLDQIFNQVYRDLMNIKDDFEGSQATFDGFKDLLEDGDEEPESGKY